jgi:hypothetical protein
MRYCSRKCAAAASRTRPEKEGFKAEKIGKVYERRCKLCVHQDRALIEQRIARGVSYGVLAKQYGLTPAGICRHWSAHVSQKTKAAIIAGPVRRAEMLAVANEASLSTLEYLAIVRGRLFDRFLACDEAADTYGVATIARTLMPVLAELGRQSGELRDFAGGNVINIDNRTLVMSSPIVAEIEAGLVRVLGPFPEARAAVIAMLQGIDRRDAVPPVKQIEAKAMPEAATA